MRDGKGLAEDETHATYGSVSGCPAIEQTGGMSGRGPAHDEAAAADGRALGEAHGDLYGRSAKDAAAGVG